MIDRGIGRYICIVARLVVSGGVKLVDQYVVRLLHWPVATGSEEAVLITHEVDTLVDG